MIILSRRTNEGTYQYKNWTIWTKREAFGWKWSANRNGEIASATKAGTANTEDNALKNAAKYIDECK